MEPAGRPGGRRAAVREQGTRDWMARLTSSCPLFLLPSSGQDIKRLYRQVGVELKATSFLFVDTQIADESFLEDINNILSSGEVPNLYKADEFEEVRALPHPPPVSPLTPAAQIPSAHPSPSSGHRPHAHPLGLCHRRQPCKPAASCRSRRTSWSRPRPSRCLSPPTASSPTSSSACATTCTSFSASAPWATPSGDPGARLSHPPSWSPSPLSAPLPSCLLEQPLSPALHGRLLSLTSPSLPVPAAHAGASPPCWYDWRVPLWLCVLVLHF